MITCQLAAIKVTETRASPWAALKATDKKDHDVWSDQPYDEYSRLEQSPAQPDGDGQSSKNKNEDEQSDNQDVENTVSVRASSNTKEIHN